MSDALDTSGFVTVESGDTPVLTPIEAPAAEEGTQEEAPTVEDAGEQPGDDGADDGGEEQPQPKRKTFQDRMDEVTRARREAEREAAHWRAIAEGRGKPDEQQQDKPQAAAAPNPEDFDYGDTDPRYIAALVAHETKKGIDAARQEMAQDLHVQAQERVWEAAQEVARSDHPDFDQLVTEGAASGAWDCSPIMAQTIRSMPEGGKLAYALASDPAESKRIARLDPSAQLIEAGKILAKLTQPTIEALKPTKTATDAPEPPERTVRGAGGRFQVAPDTDDFAAFEKQYGGSFAMGG